MPEKEQLLSELMKLREACVGEDWETAAVLMRQHDSHLRQMLASPPLSELTEVLAAQRALVTEMTEWRDAVAKRLEENRHATGALRAYQEGQEGI